MKFFMNKLFGKMVLISVIASILFSQYLFLGGDEMYGIFVGLWAPTILGIYNLISIEHIDERVRRIVNLSGTAVKSKLGINKANEEK